MTVRLTSGRRMFLRGAGGAALAVPFLPSILGGRASASSAGPCVFVCLRTGHGAAWRNQFYPEAASLNESIPLGGLPWEAQRGDLVARESGAQRSLSPVLSAPAERLSDRMVSTMNVMAGVDYSIYPGHNNAFHLGGYCAELHGFDTDGSFGPSMDQVLAYSPSMYLQDAEGRPEIAIPLVNTADSLGHVRPLDPRSPVRLQRGIDSRRLWSFLFQPGGAPPRNGDPTIVNETRIAALNDVHGALSRLRSRASSPGGRLSLEDGRRLERHMDAVSGLRAHFESALACDVAQPEGGLDARQSAQVRADLTRAAVECGLSRVFNYSTGGTSFLPDDVRSRWSDLHQDFIHQVGNDPRPTEDDSRSFWWHWILQQVFEHAVLPLAQALDFEDAEGRNVLDSSLVMWTAEAGMETHQAFSVPVVTFGGLEGRFRTGQFLDYRSGELARERTTDPEMRRGLVYDQLLGTILRGFGVPLAEYDRYRARPLGTRGSTEVAPSEQPRVGGFGAYSDDQARGNGYYHDEAVRAYADEPLPGFWNG